MGPVITALICAGKIGSGIGAELGSMKVTEHIANAKGNTLFSIEVLPPQKGKTIDDALAIDNMDIVEELALPPVKIHCSVLAEDAIKSAIADYKSKNVVLADADAVNA